MTQQTPNPVQTNENEPFIPPNTFLILATIGLVVAVVVWFTQPTFGVVGYGGLGFALLSLLAWVLLSPKQARSVLTGRTARYGGTSLLVTILLIVAMVGVYAFARSQEIRIDLTEGNDFSLTEESAQAISGIAVDPTIPRIRLIAFYGAAMAGTRDQDAPLFEDYARTSGGKIEYEFIDPERNPPIANAYGITRSGQIAVVALNEAGEPDIDNAEIVNTTNQTQLTNAILKVAASGEFNAYFLNVEGGAANQMNTVKDLLTNSLDWNVQDVSLVQLTSPEGELRLNDPNLDGEIMIIPGGAQPLTDRELAVIEDYLAAGGDLLIFAGSPINEDGVSLATAENLSTLLFENFGVRFNNDVVIDLTQAAFQSALIPLATDLDTMSEITSSLAQQRAPLAFQEPSSIEIAETLPLNVLVTTLARSSDQAYAKTDPLAIYNSLESEAALQEAAAKTEDDPQGPFVLAASAENTETGARVILFSSTSIASDGFVLAGVGNINAALNSIIWATDFADFANQITVQQAVRPQDTPIFADAQAVRNINFITIILVPFGVLAIGLWVWWSNRERVR